MKDLPITNKFKIFCYYKEEIVNAYKFHSDLTATNITKNPLTSLPEEDLLSFDIKNYLNLSSINNRKLEEKHLECVRNIYYYLETYLKFKMYEDDFILAFKKYAKKDELGNWELGRVENEFGKICKKNRLEKLYHMTDWGNFIALTPEAQDIVYGHITQNY